MGSLETRRRLEARGHQTGAQTEDAIAARYAIWRASIPWSNDQIACALEARVAESPLGDYRSLLITVAAQVRDGERFSKKVLNWALPLLVTTCGICGKSALYRMGTMGRCSLHRDAATAGVRYRQQVLDQQSGYVETLRTDQDRQAKAAARGRVFQHRRRQKA